MQRNNLYLMQMQSETETKISLIKGNLEEVLRQSTLFKSDLADLQSSDKSKASLSEVQAMLEKINRIEMMINDGESVDSGNNDDRDGSSFTADEDDDLDPEELKD